MGAQEEVFTYPELRRRFGQGKRQHLLLGNGFSIGCNKDFNYESLYEHAKPKLSERVQSVFSYVGNNFERVLRMLKEAKLIAETYAWTEPDDGKAKISDDFEAVKEGLIEAVVSKHLPRPSDVSEDQKRRASAFLIDYHNIFTLNYDLLLYWLCLSSDELLKRDGFADDPEDRDADYCVFRRRIGNDPGMYLLHGGLHLYVAAGEIRKHTWRKTGVPLVESITAALKRDQFPLFVAEGTSANKIEQINASSYLWYCFVKFSDIKGPLVTYGWSFGDSDAHIVNAIAWNTQLPTLYVGLYGDPNSDGNKEIRDRAQGMKEQRRRILNERKGKDLEVFFYQSETAGVWEAPK